MDQTIILSPEERKTMRAALAHYHSHCLVRQMSYSAHGDETATKEYGQMKDDTMRLLSRIDE